MPTYWLRYGNVTKAEHEDNAEVDSDMEQIQLADLYRLICLRHYTWLLIQEAQLSQRGRAMPRVVEYFG